MEDGFEFIVKNKGINTKVAYPYQATDGTCNTKEEAVHAATITGYEKVPANSESALLQAVANQPVSVAIDASGMGFQFYSGGVFTGDFGTDLDHGVTSLLNQMELYVVVYILAILGLDSLQGIMLDQGSCIDTCCTFCRKGCNGIQKGTFCFNCKNNHFCTRLLDAGNFYLCAYR
uniref:Peptidase C1A papain C-terminal domain-containing protein n=1 Tax=Lactuca sativa TaxID=4236 RepID=A0A9R1XM54_LACSA|nr:hypothetical protein LSAT_V11C200055670 [Lactuca sativa]